MNRDPAILFERCLHNPNTVKEMSREELEETLHFACDRWLVEIANNPQVQKIVGQ